MFYKFDRNTLQYKKDHKKIWIALPLVILLMVGSFFFGRFVRLNALDIFEKELFIINVDARKNKFTEEKFVEELKRLNVKFPYIIMGQAIVETSNFESKIFKENHNLFGMKQAIFRINTAKGTQYSHAYYENWFESVYDYAFYQCRYLSDIDTEDEYYSFLAKYYAEDPLYVSKVKNAILKQNLKELFN
jgi:uncharacterized FlgJ-related protein